jgi:hypothetical protein
VAKLFSKLLQDEYLAGIWKQDFRVGLLWAITPQESRTSRVNPDLLRILARQLTSPPTAALSGPSWSWASRFGDPDTMSFSVRSFETPQRDPHAAHMLDSDIVTLFGDKFAQVRLGRITLRGFCQTINIKLSGPSIQLTEPTNIGWHQDDTERWDVDLPPKLTPLPQLTFELESTGDVTVDGSIGDFYGLLAKLQTSSIEAEAATMMFQGLLICKFHTKSQSSDASRDYMACYLTKYMKTTTFTRELVCSLSIRLPANDLLEEKRMTMKILIHCMHQTFPLLQ